MISCGVSSSKTIAASTQSSAAMTSARSASGLTGRVGPLVGAHRPVGVDADDERVAQRAGRLQVPDVSGVQQVVDAVGEHHALALAAQPRDQRDAGVDRGGQVGAHRPRKNMNVPTSARG